jgi:hypothetical protein
MRSQRHGMFGAHRAVALGLALVAAGVLTIGAAVAQPTPDAQPTPTQEVTGSTEQLQLALRSQQTSNAALQARIEKLKQMLQGDVCADPKAAEALLNEKLPPPAAE